MARDTHRIVLYSHDSMGLGHLRRNLALAHHLATHLPQVSGKDISGLLVCGLIPGDDVVLPQGFDWLYLPSIKKEEGVYVPRHLNASFGELSHLRSGLLSAALSDFDPDLVIIDRHILGVGGELLNPLRAVRKNNPAARIVLGLREVLDHPEQAQKEWAALGPVKELRTLIDEIWIYGDPKIHNPLSTGEIPANFRDLCVFTGYLSRGRHCDDHPLPAELPYILTTVGGGQDGALLLHAALGITPPHGMEHIIVTGPQMSDSTVQHLASRLPARTQLIRSLPGMPKAIGHAQAVIAMAGYNTTCEILASRTPALLVPRETPRQEQLIRATALAHHNAVDMLRASDVSVAALDNWVHTVSGMRDERSSVQLDGLKEVLRRALNLVEHTSTTIQKEI